MDEALLQFCWMEDGSIGMSFHIYDASGRLVADSGGISPVSPVRITDQDGEVLLDVPEEIGRPIQYRLYNKSGSLLTASDGARTQIFGFLKMDTRIS